MIGLHSGEYGRTYRSIVSLLDKHEISRGQNDEIEAYLYFLTLAVAGEKANEFVPHLPTGFIMRRSDLYSQTEGEEVRAEWLFSDTGNWKSNALLCSFLIFGDLLINEEARKHYQNAPMMVHDFSDVTAFSLCMIHEVLPIVGKYVEYVGEFCKLNSQNEQTKPAGVYRVAPPQDRYPTPKPSSEYVSQNKYQKENKKQSVLYTLIGILFVCVVVLGISMYCMSVRQNTETSGVQHAAPTNAPRPTTTPMWTYNGQKIIVPGYAATCPFSVIADSSTDYYVYLDYQRAPHYSDEKRTISPYGFASNESDVAFIVKAGQLAAVDVPIGTYKMYYATGKDFYGTSELFGDSTRCYAADELLTFYLAGNYYQGHTITLKTVYNGNFETDEISENSFPKR